MEFLLLGPVEARSDGQPVALGRRHQRRLLGLLLLEARRPVPVERLVGLIWDDDPPDSVRAVLQTHMSRLRSSLQPHGVHLLTRGDAYLADIDPHNVDVHRFAAMVAGARRLAQPTDRVAVLADALALWRGPLMCDVVDDPLRQRIGAELDELHLTAYELLAEALLADGQHDRIAADLTEVVRQHPTRERLVGMLMTGLYRAGRQVDALALFRDVRDTLATEFGVDPGPELTQLHRQVLANDEALDPPATRTSMSLAPAVPTPGVSRSGPANLPRRVLDFVGRDRELARLDALVHTDGPPPAVVVTAIGGAGGIGKTALAVLWAHRAADHFPDGQLFIDLHGYDGGRPVTPANALTRLLRGLGVPTDQLPTDPDQAADLYRATVADKKMIIVLDNARSVDQVRPLIQGGPSCFVVVTSRDRLGGLVARDGAIAVTLGVLDPDEALDLLARVLGADRVSAEPKAAAELARLCGYLPLALRIAAALLLQDPGRGIEVQVAALTSARLSALAVDGDDASALTSVFDQSYTALGEGERRLFRIIGALTVPDLTTEAAAAAADVPVPLAAELLRSLRDAHLVLETAPGRHGLHDLLREYARHRTALESSTERDEATRRLLSWYLDHVDAAAGQLYPYKLRLYTMDSLSVTFASPAEASAWLGAERNCLLAAIADSAERGPVDMAVRILDGLRNYFDQTADSVSALAAAEPVLAAAQRSGDRTAQALGHLALAAAYARETRLDLALEHHRACVESSAASGWTDGEAAAANSLGSVYAQIGQVEESIEHLQRALELNRRSGRRQAEATNLGNLGYAYMHTGPIDAAVECYTAALRIRQEIGGSAGLFTIITGLGNAARYQRRFAEAEQYHQQVLAIATDSGNIHLRAAALDNLAGLNRDLGNLEEALTLVESAIALMDQAGDQGLRVYAYLTKADVEVELGRHAVAAELYEQCLRAGRQTGMWHAEAEALIGLARTHCAGGQWDDAEASGQEALRIAASRGLRPTEGYALTALAETSLGRGDLDQAAARAQAALDVQHAAGALLAEQRAQAVLDQATGAIATPD